MVSARVTPSSFANPDFFKACQTIYNPVLMTELLRQAVPVLESSDWSITHVAPGFAQTRLPINHATTNQHGTHQAALISLSADYTGGMALTTAFGGAPLAGIHRCEGDDSAALWLVGMNMRYHKPSTDHLIGTCQIPAAQFEKLSNRYRHGKRVLVTLQIELSSNNELIASGELKYYAQTTSSLRTSNGAKLSALVEQKLKASARMIAGIRAMNTSPRPTFVNNNGQLVRLGRLNLDAHAAGAHGMLLAEKMKSKLPQLVEFVQSRTNHIDEFISRTEALEQLVFVGSGFDMRSLLHARLRPELRFFDLDLPEMLHERARIIRDLRDQTKLKRCSVPCDFSKDNLAKKLLGATGFDASRKTIFVFEGCSMYFDESTNRRILSELKQAMRHPGSKLWIDLVSEEVVNGETRDPGVARFLQAMADLGEKFVFGRSRASDFLNSLGFKDVTTVSSAETLDDNAFRQIDSVFSHYWFCIAANDYSTVKHETLRTDAGIINQVNIRRPKMQIHDEQRLDS